MITAYQKARWQSVSDNTPPAAVPVAGEEDEATELSLGTIDEIDETWLNGQPLGYTSGPDVPSRSRCGCW